MQPSEKPPTIHRLGQRGHCWRCRREPVIQFQVGTIIGSFCWPCALIIVRAVREAINEKR